jgi:hypothetical protein
LSTSAPFEGRDVYLALPPTWSYIACDEEQAAVDVPAQVDARIAEEPELAVYREAVIGPMLGLSRTVAATPGGLFAARRWDMVGGHLVMGTLIAKLLGRPEGPPGEELDRLRSFVATPSGLDHVPPRLERVTLRTGEALRVEALRQPPDIGSEKQPLRLVVEFWAPLQDDLGTVKLSFSTACFASAPLIVSELDAMAACFELRRPA